MNKLQWIALGIFLLSYGLIISNKINRTIAALIGAILVYIFILKPKDLLHYENWETIIFIFGTYFHLSFMDFVRNIGLIAICGFILNTIFFIIFYRKDIFPIRNELKK